MIVSCNVMIYFGKAIRVSGSKDNLNPEYDYICSGAYPIPNSNDWTAERLSDLASVMAFFNDIATGHACSFQVRGLESPEGGLIELIRQKATRAGLKFRSGQTHDGPGFSFDGPVNETFLNSFTLPQWGDYAFTLLHSKILDASQNHPIATPRERLDVPTLCDIVELPWNGTFSVHGVYTRLDLQVFETHEGLWKCLPNPIAITHEMEHGEGPTVKEIFAFDSI